MNKRPDFIFFNKLMTHANMGWWEADLKNERYICSEYITRLLELDRSGAISFEDFNKRILRKEQPNTTIHSFDTQQIPEVVYLLNTPKGPVWLRSKICFQETDETGENRIYGIAELQDGPNMTLLFQARKSSERILYNIYKNLPVGLEVYNREGILLDVNDKELEMFHLNRKEDILGVNIFENPIFPKEMKEELRKGKNLDFTFRYDFSKVNGYYTTRKKTGTIDLTTKLTVLYDENHEPAHYVLINTDKTETTVAYNRIQEFENLFDLVGDYSKVGYAYFNILSGKGHAPKSWYKNLGEKDETPLNEIIGVYGHVHPEDRAVMTDFVDKAKKGEASKLSREVRILREDGGHTWTYVNLLVETYAPQDHLIEFISINYDITDLKKTEEKLTEARNRAEKSDRLKSAFLANMSHEIRTPLNAIVGFSNLLSLTDDASEKEQYCSLISHNNELLLKLINDVLEISKIESGDVNLHPVWFDLSEFIRECTVQYAREAASQDVEFRCKCPEPDYMVELDRRCVGQVLHNLASNAAKNTERGYIELSYEVSDHGVQISVADTGCGIPRNKLEKIFERFEKVDSFVQGAGLGLSLSKSIVEQMNGQIDVESEEGVGSTFRIELPCEPIPVDSRAL